ncbi:hypothetical protein V1264_006377 [Littorina saxatilis]|uniref:G-protein coupled receptors family 1 profile domain-containing protein n=1 Tax=Littorina saxatilis TaxID=31220 RepID=A0AAN9AXK7_9CAEN
MCNLICEIDIIPVTADVSLNNTSSAHSDEKYFASSGERHSGEQLECLSVNSTTLRPPFPSVKCPGCHLTHTFLANDVTSKCWSTDDVINSVHCESRDPHRPCQTSVTRLLESYRCESWEQRVPYSLLCDRRDDCRDQSDEDFCVFKPCNLTVEFECHNKQCVERRHVCDDFPDCVDRSDEFCFHQRLLKSKDPPMIVHFFKRGLWHETMTDPALCAENGTHFLCANGDLCLPVFLRCNGIYDCPGREDEADCRSYTCPGFYRCRGSAVCLHTRHLCDDIPQCPQHDDEIFCNLACPTNCTCQGLSYLCTQPFSAHLHLAVRYLDARDSGMQLTALSSNTMLVYLSLARSDVTDLGNVTLPNLRFFDLSFNQLNKISGTELRSLANLKLLILRGNPLKCQFKSDDSLFEPHQNLRQLDMSQVFIEQLDVSRLGFAPNLHSLNLSQSGIRHVSATGFQSLKNLSRLDIRDCPLTTFPLDLFTGLGELDAIDADNYRVCCPGVLPQYFDLNKCRSLLPAVSTCANLIGAKSNHIILSVIAILSFFSNSATFVTRVFIRRNRQHGSGGVLMTYLTAADFLMALHLCVVLVADAAYRDRYVFSDQQWRHSAACSVSGFLATLSIVVSTTVLWLLSSLCVLTQCEPRRLHQLGEVSAHAVCVTVWVAGAVLASLPLLPVTLLRGEFSHTALCRPFPETASHTPTPIHDSLELFSLVASILSAVGIAVVNLRDSNDDKFTLSNGDSDAELSPRPRHDRFIRQVGELLVFSCLCRFLVGVFSVLPLGAQASARDVRLSVSLVVLPLSSALNPVLLWLGMARESARRQKHERLMKRLLAQQKNC